MKSVVLPLVLLMAGCVLQTGGRQAEQAWFDEAFVLGSAEQRSESVTQSVDKPWLLGDAVPLRKKPVMPAVLRPGQTFSFSLEEPLPSLDELARRLSALSDLSVTISPEARLPLAHFLPRLNVNEEALEPAPRGGLVFEQLRLSDLLDQIAAVYSLSWRLHAGRIELYRIETRRFDLPVAATEQHVRSAQAADRGGLGDTVLDRGQDEGRGRSAAAYLQDMTEMFLSRAGKVRVLGHPPHALLVTDTPARLSALGLALKQQPELWHRDGMLPGKTQLKGGR